MSIENTFYSHMDQNADECIMSNAELHEFRGGDKIYVKGITQVQLANLYRNGFTDIEIVEETKSKDDNKKETSK